MDRTLIQLFHPFYAIFCRKTVNTKPKSNSYNGYFFSLLSGLVDIRYLMLILDLILHIDI